MTLDQVIQFPAQICTGSYVGTGTYGKDNPCLLYTSGMSELSPEGGSEGYGGCDDDVKSLDESVDGMMSVMAGLGSKAQRPAQFFLGTRCV